jgi:hypothetical protein
MGLFGTQDAAEVSDNPFHVDEGVYTCVLSQFELRYNEAKEQYNLLMQWSIEDTDSPFEGMNLSEWIRVYPTPDSSDDVPQRNLQMDMARAKSRLTALGLSIAEMNELIDDDAVFNDGLAEKYIGTVRLVEVVERPDKNDPDKKYTNIKSVTDPAE